MEGIERAVPSVQLTKKLVSYINDVLEKETDGRMKKELQHYVTEKEGTPIPFHLVRHVFQTLKNQGEEVYIHEMISGSNIALPSVRFPPRDPELEARVQKLKAAEEEREYRRMTGNVDPVVKNEIRFQEDVKNLNRQIISVVNFLVTVGGAFAFGYKGMEYAVGGKVFPLQMTVGFCFAVVVFIADLYFLVKYSPQ